MHDILAHQHDYSFMTLFAGERPFICHVCGKGLISDKKLKRHLLIHSEVYRHTCEECGQGFSMKYKLRTHMYTHTGKIVYPILLYPLQKHFWGYVGITLSICLFIFLVISTPPKQINRY